MKGTIRPAVAKTMRHIIAEEMKHCDKLAKRIEELGGRVEWEHSDIGEHAKPGDDCVYKHIRHHQDLETELMDLYNEIIQYTENRDHTTYYVINKIMNDEHHHY
jgi:bacterioferritin (cytochrome b1)